MDNPSIPFGDPETNQGAGEDLAGSQTNEPSLGNKWPKETLELVGSQDPPTTNPTTAAAAEHPVGDLPVDPSYLRELVSEINVEVQLLIWTMPQFTPELHQSVGLAHRQIAVLSQAMNNQATAISAQTRMVAPLQCHPLIVATPAPPQREPKSVKAAPAPQARQKTYAGEVSAGPAPAATNNKWFPTVNHKKTKPTTPATFTPEYTKTYRQFVVKTESPFMDRVTNDWILHTMNRAVAHECFRFLAPDARNRAQSHSKPPSQRLRRHRHRLHAGNTHGT